MLSSLKLCSPHVDAMMPRKTFLLPSIFILAPPGVDRFRGAWTTSINSTQSILWNGALNVARRQKSNALLDIASSFLWPLQAHDLSSAPLSRCRGCLRRLHVCLLAGHPENIQAGLLPTVISVTPPRPPRVTGRRNNLKTLTDHLLDPSTA